MTKWLSIEILNTNDYISIRLSNADIKLFSIDYSMTTLLNILWLKYNGGIEAYSSISMKNHQLLIYQCRLCNAVLNLAYQSGEMKHCNG